MAARSRPSRRQESAGSRDGPSEADGRLAILDDYRSQLIRTWSYVQGCVSTIGFAALLVAVATGLGLLSFVNRTIEERVESQVHSEVSTQVAGLTTQIALAGTAAAQAEQAAARAEAAAATTRTGLPSASTFGNFTFLVQGPWAIVVGSTETLEEARSLKAAAVSAAYSAAVDESEGGFLVAVGRYSTRAEAEAALQQVRDLLSVPDAYAFDLLELCSASALFTGDVCPPAPIE